ncbi:MAG: uracil-DNA glycosylase [Thermoplasmatota archaeon]
MDRAALDALHARIRACIDCRLGETRIQAVPGEGAGVFGHQPEGGVLDVGATPWSGVMLVGEAPGRNEDETGRPFCGAAGKNLDLGLAAAGIPRAEVFVTSINKCRPPKNRDPKPDEKAACTPYLLEQIEALAPKVLVALGRHGLSGLVDAPPKTFGDVRGRFMDGPGGVPVFCSLHPAAIIYRQTWRETYLDDWAWLGRWVSDGAKVSDIPTERQTPSV